MAAVWAEEEKLRIWLEVELLASEARAERGEIPSDVPARLRAQADVNVERMRAIEREAGHDVIAFVGDEAGLARRPGSSPGPDVLAHARHVLFAATVRRRRSR